ncbi:MAG: hypothetical protein PHU25_06815 [Deltaproteobacteria bacterium]|nr:hypothetical protein [Deltaproteobacteria bacterium]
MRVVEGLYDGKSVHPMEQVNAKPNTRVKITFPDDGNASATTRKAALDAVAGCLKWDGPAKTLEEMDEAVARGAKERPS